MRRLSKSLLSSRDEQVQCYRDDDGRPFLIALKIAAKFTFVIQRRARLVFANQRRSSSITCGDTQGLSVHTCMLPRPVRSQVACGDALYGNRTHFKDKNVFNHCMPSKATMSSHISKTTMSLVIACLQKATMTLIYISKMTMSSVIACLQRRQCPPTFQRQQCLQSLHAFKRRKGLHLRFEDDNVFSHCMPSKVTMSSSTFQRRQCLHLHFEDVNVFT